MNIVLVEDDAKLASFVVRGLREAGYAVTHAGNGEDGFYQLTTCEFDLAIVDLMLPKLDGLSLIEQIRKQGVDTPILILSAKRSVDERIEGLQAGGDDYLVKPFHFGELLARVQAILRRGSGSQPTQLAVGPFRMDLLRRKVERNGKEILLHAREFTLLEYLMRNAGKVVSKTSILQHVWGYDFDPATNVVETRICRLREKLEGGSGKSHIRTIRGFGYVLEEDSADR
jgi:DNA-binding response OmpR family regulator